MNEASWKAEAYKRRIILKWTIKIWNEEAWRIILRGITDTKDVSSLRCFHPDFVRICPISHTRCTYHPTQLRWFNEPNNRRWTVLTMKLQWQLVEAAQTQAMATSDRFRPRPTSPLLLAEYHVAVLLYTIFTITHFFVLSASQFIPHIVQYVPDHASKSPITLLLRGPCVEDDKVRHPAGKKASGKVPRQQCLYNTRSAEKRPTQTLRSVRGQFYSSDSLFICQITFHQILTPLSDKAKWLLSIAYFIYGRWTGICEGKDRYSEAIWSLPGIRTIIFKIQNTVKVSYTSYESNTHDCHFKANLNAQIHMYHICTHACTY